MSSGGLDLHLEPLERLGPLQPRELPLRLELLKGPSLLLCMIDIFVPVSEEDEIWVVE